MNATMNSKFHYSCIETLRIELEKKKKELNLKYGGF